MWTKVPAELMELDTKRGELQKTLYNKHNLAEEKPVQFPPPIVIQTTAVWDATTVQQTTINMGNVSYGKTRPRERNASRNSPVVPELLGLHLTFCSTLTTQKTRIWAFACSRVLFTPNNGAATRAASLWFLTGFEGHLGLWRTKKHFNLN